MPRHPNKHIQAAIRHAESLGWRVEKASGHAHIWGFIVYPRNSAPTGAATIHSTPRVPEHHARRIRLYVDACPHH